MLSRIVPTSGSNATLKVYSDYKNVEYWAETALEKITAKGYLGAYNDGKLHPKDNLTRGQAAKILTLVLQKETIDKNNKRIVAHDRGADIHLPAGKSLVNDDDRQPGRRHVFLSAGIDKAEFRHVNGL